MSRLLSFALFLTIIVSVTGSAHYYVWARLIRDPALGPGPARLFTYLIIGLFVAIPTSLFLRRSSLASLTAPLVWVAMIWLGLLLFLVISLGAVDLGRSLWSLGRWLGGSPPLDAERRQTLARLLAAGVALLSGSLGVAALASGLGRVKVKRVEVKLARLPRALDGLRILQWSDVHIGPTIHREFIQGIVAQTNALKPDLIAITGDLVDGSVGDLAEDVAPLAELRAKYGVFFVTGNHEYYSGAEEWCSELRRLGVRVLRNERVSIGEPGASFDLAGVDDHSAARFGRGHGEDVEKALAGRDPEREVVLLAHQPRTIFEAEKHGVGLQLSGHTHGGQLWPWTYLVRLQQPVVAGLERFGRSLIYVSSGTGYWGPPMRLGAPAELTEITLVAA
ncbi:MAG TPA: metallophosphoesterase [Polyangiaceae bacterium]|jgi:hypothetical protein